MYRRVAHLDGDHKRSECRPGLSTAGLYTSGVQLSQISTNCCARLCTLPLSCTGCPRQCPCARQCPYCRGIIRAASPRLCRPGLPCGPASRHPAKHPAPGSLSRPGTSLDWSSSKTNGGRVRGEKCRARGRIHDITPLLTPHRPRWYPCIATFLPYSERWRSFSHVLERAPGY